MTLAQHRREIRRLQQRAARAQVRLNKFRFKLKLEGIDYDHWRVSSDQSETYWRLFWLNHNEALDLQRKRVTYQIKKLVEKTMRA